MSTVPDVRATSDPCSCGFALQGRDGVAYNEEAFRYFLAIERERARRARRSLLLVLLELREPPSTEVRFHPVVANRLFSGLWRCLRETDIVGWYREGRVAGVLLTDLDDERAVEISRLVLRRIRAVLEGRLPSDAARRLQASVNQYPEAERLDSGTAADHTRQGLLIPGELSW